jgi:2-polyprenyl-3-methyl-5-hydroxy-6-metoxy-1,4-benzoquinol methylase
MFGQYKDTFGNLASIYSCHSCNVLYNATLELSQAAYSRSQFVWGLNNKMYEMDGDISFESLTASSSIFDWLEQTTAVNLDGLNLLEIGAGNGVRTASGLKFFSKVFASDLNMDSINRLEKALDTNRFQGIEPRKTDSVKADFLLAWHALEHFDSPYLVFSKLRTIIKEGGFLFIQIPLITERFVFPEHLWFFSEVSLTRILNGLGIQNLEFYYDIDLCSLTCFAQL